MVTKGVASVRSPVCNLSQFKPTIGHDMFVDAVVKSFRAEYDIEVDDEIVHVMENSESSNIPYIKAGMQELKVSQYQMGLSLALIPM
jgi:lipoate---protein ligase